MAIESSPTKSTALNEIYRWMTPNYSYFAPNNKTWKSTIRHNLAVNKAFVKKPRPESSKGLGCLWTVDADVAIDTKLIRGKSYFPNPAASGLSWYQATGIANHSPYRQIYLPQI